MDLGGWFEAYVGLHCSISEQYMFETFCWKPLNNLAIFLHRELKEETPDTLGAGSNNSKQHRGEKLNYGDYILMVIN